MTDSIDIRTGKRWTIDDLDQLSDDDLRYEIVEGALLVSAAASPRHGEVLFLLRRLLDRQAPDDLAVSNDVGIRIGDNYSYLIPDLFVIPRAAFRRHPKYLVRTDVRLVVEVLSEQGRSRDRVLKRLYYAVGGIPRYWIVDPVERALTVLALEGKAYVEEAVVKAGTAWSTEHPFPLTLDPADFCQPPQGR